MKIKKKNMSNRCWENSLIIFQYLFAVLWKIQQKIEQTNKQKLESKMKYAKS